MLSQSGNGEPSPRAWVCSKCLTVYSSWDKAQACGCEPARPDANARQIGGDHYARQSIQPWDAMEAWMTRNEFIGFLRGNAIKYLARMGSKDAASQDARKAEHYCVKLAEMLEAR